MDLISIIVTYYNKLEFIKDTLGINGIEFKYEKNINDSIIVMQNSG